MKKRVVLIGLVVLVFGVSVYRAHRSYTEQQTCVAPDGTDAVTNVVGLALSSEADNLVAAAAAFAGLEAGQEQSSALFGDPLPSDICFSERLYIKAARQGSRLALEHLEALYNCNNAMAFGIANAAAHASIKERLSGIGDVATLQSQVGVLSYYPNPFNCGGQANMMCQTLPRTHPAWQTKQAILCDETWQ